MCDDPALVLTSTAYETLAGTATVMSPDDAVTVTWEGPG